MQKKESQQNNFHIGDYAQEALNGGHKGWFIGKFMEIEPQKTNAVEIKYWEFEVGSPNHETKISKTIEVSLILEGEIEGEIDGKQIQLGGGQYVVIKPNTPNGFPKVVHSKVRGLTIKAPSDPSAKKIIGKQ